MPVSDRGARRHDIDLPNFGTIPVYAHARVGRALDEVTEDMTVYTGARLLDVLEAVYKQGLKDGRAEVFEAVADSLDAVEKRGDLVHANPGRPRKTR